jgi:hypothetical protein
MEAATTAKRGIKAAPKSKPGKWDRPERQISCTKKGPGRKAKASASNAPRTAAAAQEARRERRPQARKRSAPGRPPHSRHSTPHLARR